jgi:hypothetical protein
MRRDDSDRIEKQAATSLTTALALLLTLTLCGPAAVAQSAAFHANGAFANVVPHCSGPTFSECFSVSVSTSSVNGPTFLSYDHFIFDPNTGGPLQDTFGFGTIPNSAFQLHGTTDSLNVDTSTVAGFFNLFCTFDPNTGVPTCNSIPGGVVTGTWTVITNLDTTHITGTVTVTSPGLKSVFTGTSDSHAALASVNILGAASPNSTGSVGTNHNTSISVQVLH